VVLKNILNPFIFTGKLVWQGETISYEVISTASGQSSLSPRFKIMAIEKVATPKTAIFSGVHSYYYQTCNTVVLDILIGKCKRIPTH
jgi:hypothetical protein